MNLRTLILIAPVAVVLACGGSTGTGKGSAALDAATPSFEKLALDQVATDTTAPSAVLEAAPLAVPTAAMAGPVGICHPHLFMREREVVERVNRHIYKVLRLVELVIATNPVDSTATSKTWTRTEAGVDVSFTITLVGPSVYSWELAAGPTGITPLPVPVEPPHARTTATGAMRIRVRRFMCGLRASSPLGMGVTTREGRRSCGLKKAKTREELRGSRRACARSTPAASMPAWPFPARGRGARWRLAPSPEAVRRGPRRTS